MATQASDTTNTAAGKRRGASADELAVIAQRAQAFTNASGVAVALTEGNADEIVCRARSGASAPDVGAVLRVEGTFTGLCIQTGKELRCDDCETDTRVDMAAIRALGIRSMVVTPIREENRVIGVLAAFAPTPHAFTITHVAVLKTMADQIAVLLQKERRMRDENPQAVAPSPSAPAIVAKPVDAPTPVVPPVVIKSAAPQAAASAPAFSKVEPIRSTPLEVVPLATPPKAEKRIEIEPRANFGTFDSVSSDEPKSGNKFMMIGVVAVVIIAAAVTFTFLKMQKSKAPQAQESASTTQPAAPVTENNAQQPVVPASSAAVPSTAPATVVAANSAPSSKPGADIDSHKAGKASAEKNASVQADKPAQEEKTSVVATLSNSGQSRIAHTQSQQDQQASESVPSFSVSTGSASGLTNFSTPVVTSAPTKAAPEQSRLEPLQLVKTVPLVYPIAARQRNITGIAVVQVTVEKDGKISNMQYISGPPVFRDAAFNAVSHYQFKPARLNGQPIDQTTQIKLKFN